MDAHEVREGDIVQIEYDAKFTKEHVDEGKALVIWKGFNHQPLVRKLDTKTTIWTCYENIAKVIGHVDIEGYMDKVLSAEPCEDAISRAKAIEEADKLCLETGYDNEKVIEMLNALPPVNPQEQKIGHWIPVIDRWG